MLYTTRNEGTNENMERALLLLLLCNSCLHELIRIISFLHFLSLIVIYIFLFRISNFHVLVHIALVSKKMRLSDSKDFEFVEHFVGLLQHFFALARISLFCFVLQAYSPYIFLQYKCEVGSGDPRCFERWSLVFFRGARFSKWVILRMSMRCGG